MTAPPRRIGSQQEAEKLDDGRYLAYCLVQACKLFIKLMTRRFPELG